MEPPPYRIETARLVIRCWRPTDAAALGEAVEESLDDLKRWMYWAHEEPKILTERVDLLRGLRGKFDRREEFLYGIFSPTEDAVLGRVGLHTRVGDDAFEIGYWIRSSATGQGFATEATAAVTRAAFTHSAAERVEIHVDPENTTSTRIPRNLGFAEEARLRRRLTPLVPGGPRSDALIFTLFAEEFSRSTAADVSITAFDAANWRLS
jgi:RimJ/RimL family protein N-acetyltransferase